MVEHAHLDRLAASGAALGVFLGLAQSLAPTTGAREVRVSTTAELRAALDSASPGTRILVAAGEYQGLHAANVRGTADKPIVVAAASEANPPQFASGVHFSDVAYFELAGLRFMGAESNGLNIDDGGTLDSPSHHVVLRDLTVRDCGGRGNDDGIKLSGVDDFLLERCTVERWGRGGSGVDMVGCHRGTLESCMLRDREQAAAANGVQIKGGSRDVVVRRCRFEHAGERAVNVGGSTGLEYFRPKPEGFEAKDITVEGCTFIGSNAAIAFVGVDGASARWNTIYRPAKWVLRILQETREPGFVACRGGQFTDNLIAYDSRELATAVNVGPHTAPETFEFARNYWFCIDDPSRARPQLPVSEIDPKGGADPRFRDGANGELTLADDSPARAHGASALPAVKKR